MPILTRHFFVAPIIVLALSGCMNPALVQHQYRLEQEAQLQQRTKTQLQAIQDGCDEKRRSEPGLISTLSSKIPRTVDEMTVAMMISTEKPTEEERRLILRSAEIALECQRDMLAVVRQSAPAPYANTMEAAFNHAMGMRLELYHGRLTYGEYNRQSKEVVSRYRQVLAQIDAELKRQDAEAYARAQQLANDQQRLFLNYLSNYNNYILQQQGQQQLRHGSITCSKIGQFTTCNY